MAQPSRNKLKKRYFIAVEHRFIMIDEALIGNIGQL